MQAICVLLRGRLYAMYAAMGRLFGVQEEGVIVARWRGRGDLF